MRSSAFLIFFGVVILIYALVNYYLYVRGLQVFSLSQPLRRWYIAIFIILASSFIFGAVLERNFSSAFSEWIYRVGVFWLAFMLYFTLALVLIDIVRIINYFFPFISPFSEMKKLRLGFIVIGIVSFIVVLGHINALIINVKQIQLNIDKEVSGKKELKVLMASDLHLGALIGERREMQLIDIIKNTEPDLVLLCGDLVDGEIAPVLRKNLGTHIQEIETPLGVYAISGNHEYIGGIKKTLPYLTSININMLIDELVVLPNGIQLIGRNDIAGRNAVGVKPLAELIDSIDFNKPIIVMNHQPFNLDEAAKLKVDLHLSGHTHNGQLWPLNYITDAIFELGWGLLKKGNTYFYVSSGFGTWGPPVRTGNRPEVVVFNIRFK